MRDKILVRVYPDLIKDLPRALFLKSVSPSIALTSLDTSSPTILPATHPTMRIIAKIINLKATYIISEIPMDGSLNPVDSLERCINTRLKLRDSCF